MRARPGSSEGMPGRGWLLIVAINACSPGWSFQLRWPCATSTPSRHRATRAFCVTRTAIGACGWPRLSQQRQQCDGTCDGRPHAGHYTPKAYSRQAGRDARRNGAAARCRARPCDTANATPDGRTELCQARHEHGGSDLATGRPALLLVRTKSARERIPEGLQRKAAVNLGPVEIASMEPPLQKISSAINRVPGESNAKTSRAACSRSDARPAGRRSRRVDYVPQRRADVRNDLLFGRRNTPRRQQYFSSTWPSAPTRPCTTAAPRSVSCAC